VPCWRPFVLISLAACAGGFRGESGFTPGRAQLVPCRDAGGESGALLIIESAVECWPSFGAERATCEQRRAAIAENPSFCSGGLVVDSPSRINLTSFFTTPLDPDDYRGAGAARIRNLPCNPAGPFAEGYPDFERFIEEFEGEVLVTADNGTWGRVALDVTRVGSDEPAITGEARLQICR